LLQFFQILAFSFVRVVHLQQFPLIPCECYATMVADSSASVSTIRFCLLKQRSGSDMTGCLVESGLVW
jgi:hypothetical protein